MGVCIILTHILQSTELKLDPWELLFYSQSETADLKKTSLSTPLLDYKYGMSLP